MTLMILFGPHAVGKMTVGQALEARTGLRLFHNHMTIELASRFFDYGTPEGSGLVHKLRWDVFEAVAGSDLPGLIFTFMWALDKPSDWAYIKRVTDLFEGKGARTLYVELEADYDVRIERNKTENRLLHKPTKRDVATSEARFRSLEARYRLNTREGEMPFEHYMKLNNTHLQPEEAAELIARRFAL